MKSTLRTVTVVLALFLVGTSWKAMLLAKEKRSLAEGYAKAQQALDQVEVLREELSQVLGNAELSPGDIASLQAEVKRIRERFDATAAELATLRESYTQLRSTHESTLTQLSASTQHKQQLEARLSSLKELKLAMRDLKRRIRAERLMVWVTRWRARVRAVQEQDQRQLALGNRGYLVRGGTTTMGSGTRLLVHVLDPESP